MSVQHTFIGLAFGASKEQEQATFVSHRTGYPLSKRRLGACTFLDVQGIGKYEEMLGSLG
ncbi:hypothetical protein Hanom_Chr03g00195741 [Helianthus anomalus]